MPHGGVPLAAMAALAKGGRDKLTFSVGAPVDRFGLWAEQLLAESTGTEGKGVIPVAQEPMVPPSAYGQDRLFVALRLALYDGFFGNAPDG